MQDPLESVIWQIQSCFPPSRKWLRWRRLQPCWTAHLLSDNGRRPYAWARSRGFKSSAPKSFNQCEVECLHKSCLKSFRAIQSLQSFMMNVNLRVCCCAGLSKFCQLGFNFADLSQAQLTDRRDWWILKVLISAYKGQFVTALAWQCNAEKWCVLLSGLFDSKPCERRWLVPKTTYNWLLCTLQ